MAALTERQQARMAREQEIRVELARLAGDGRADNREAVRLYRTRHGTGMSDNQIRPPLERALYLPGRDDHEKRVARRSALAETFARDGFRLVYCRDLCSTNCDEETGRNRAQYDLDG